jgi:hypothetical protein
MDESSARMVSLSATDGRDPEVVQPKTMTWPMCAQDAETRIMEPRLVLKERKHKTLTPYNTKAWHQTLEDFNLSSRYLHIPDCLETGFSGGIPTIEHMYAPPNNASVVVHTEAFQNIVNTEFSKGRFVDPFSIKELESVIGPFQMSPLSIIPKPGNQVNLDSYKTYPSPIILPPIKSINSRVDWNLFPCTYSTFATICRYIRSLPPGSQAAVCDVAEAYQTVSLYHSQWAGLVVRLPGKDAFAVDTALCFGFGPSVGICGNIADTGADIFCASGLGLLSKLVDDYLFFRIR